MSATARYDGGTSRPEPATRLDAVDMHIVEELRRDARLPVVALASRVGLSRAAAYKRLARLEDAGAVTGYTVRSDPAALGLPLAAIILIRTDQRSWRDVRNAVLELDALEYLAYCTGEFDFLALVRARDMNALRDAVLQPLNAIPGLLTTRTTLVLDELTSHARIPRGDAGQR